MTQKDGAYVTTTADNQGPQDLLDVLSEIEQFSVAEKMGSPIPDEALTTKHLLSYFWIGFMRFVKTVLVTTVSSLFFCWSNNGLISVFGTYQLLVFDRIFIVVFTIALPISNSFFVSRIVWKLYIGSVTQKAIFYLCSGILAGTVFSASAIIILSHNVYYQYLTPEAFAEIMPGLPQFLQPVQGRFHWMTELFKQVIPGGYVAAFFSFAAVLIIGMSIAVGKIKTRKINRYREVWQ